MEKEEQRAAVVGHESYVPRRTGETFPNRLLFYIDKKRMERTDVWKNAGIDRQLFSKITTAWENYRPKRETAFALAVGLRLTVEEADDFLLHAGLAFSPGDIGDIIIRDCIRNGEYDIMEINKKLYRNRQPLLGSKAAHG